MATTPKLLLPYPGAADPADVPTDMGELALQIDNLAGTASGLATLDATGKVPAAQIPASGASIPARHSCRAKNVVGQALTDSVAAVATFEAEDWDSDNLHDNAVNPTRISIPAGLLGVWVFNFQVELPNPGQAHTAVCWLRKAGATFIAGQSHFGSWGPGNHVLAGFSVVELVTAATYYEAMLTFQSGAARTTISMSFAASLLSS